MSVWLWLLSGGGGERGLQLVLDLSVICSSSCEAWLDVLVTFLFFFF